MNDDNHVTTTTCGAAIRHFGQIFPISRPTPPSVEHLTRRSSSFAFRTNCGTHTLHPSSPMRLLGRNRYQSRVSYWSSESPNRLKTRLFGKCASSRSPTTMKRKAPPVNRAASSAKKRRPDVPKYHLTPSVLEADGAVQWPAPRSQMESARRMIIDW